MGSISIEVNETVLKKLVYAYLADKLGNIDLKPTDVKIEVKSKQNYRAEWETASFKATVNKMI